MAKFHIDPWSLEASAGHRRGDMHQQNFPAIPYLLALVITDFHRLRCPLIFQLSRDFHNSAIVHPVHRSTLHWRDARASMRSRRVRGHAPSSGRDMLLALSTLALCLRTCGECPPPRAATPAAFRAQIAPDQSPRTRILQVGTDPARPRSPPPSSQRPCRVARLSTAASR